MPQAATAVARDDAGLSLLQNPAATFEKSPHALKELDWRRGCPPLARPDKSNLIALAPYIH